MLEDVIPFHAATRNKRGGMSKVLEVKMLVDGEIQEPKLIHKPINLTNKPIREW